MSTNPDLDQRLTLRRGTLRALLHIADTARVMAWTASLRGQRANLTLARALARTHDPIEAEILLAHIDEIERESQPPIQASQESPATTQAPEEPRTVECPRCEWHGPSTAAKDGACPECTDHVRTVGAVSL